MKREENSFFISHIALPAALIIAFALLMDDPLPAIGILVVILAIGWSPIYLRYAHDNPRHLWFKNKMFGWGWTPVTWQGWTITAAYAALLVFIFGPAENTNLSATDILVKLIIPFILATGLFLSITYKKGEHPRWQWGRGLHKRK